MAETFASPEGIFVIDDTSFPKQGKHSVGVQRQYCGALGKKANCQVAPSVHYVSPDGPLPAGDAAVPARVLARGRRSGWTRPACPRRTAGRRPRAQIALELLDTVRGEGLPGWLVVADAGYGVSGTFRDGLAARGLQYIVGVTDEMVVFTEEPTWEPPGPAERPEGTGGRPRRRPRLAEGSPRPVSLKELAAADAAAEGDLARGDQGEAVGPLRLAAGLAGRRLGHGRVRRRRADLAADRGAGRRQAEVRLQQPAGRTRAGCGRSGCGRAAGRWSRATSR